LSSSYEQRRASKRSEMSLWLLSHTKSIQSHRRCECCKAENRLKRNDFLQMSNLSDGLGLTQRQNSSAPWF
jgi:hypothetical protein